MGRVCLVGVVLAVVVGCAGEGDRGSWDEVRKDLRGDNMEMRLGSPGVHGAMRPPSEE